MQKRYLTMNDVQVAVNALVARVQRHNELPPNPKIYGVPRGGVPVAMAVAAALQGLIVGSPENADLIVDDIYDSGKTSMRPEFQGKPFRVLFNKQEAPWAGQWLVMPWEAIEGQTDHSADDVGIRLLQAVGEDPERGGLKETPQRWLAFMREATSGMGQDPAKLLKVFEDGAENVDEMVVVANIPFYSMCEHHMAPFFGVAHIAYIPGTAPQGQIAEAGAKTRIVGLSKIPRLLEMFSKRLQVQERITNQVAETMAKELGALGVGVVLRARHLCMEMRGIKKTGSITYTSALRGAIKDRPETRSEFLRFVEMADRQTGTI